MSLTTLLTTKMDIYRLIRDELLKKEVWQIIATNIPCRIEPVDENYIPLLEGAYFKSFIIYCKETDIKEGDKIKIDNDYYFINGIKNYKDGYNPHMEILVQKGGK